MWSSTSRGGLRARFGEAVHARSTNTDSPGSSSSASARPRECSCASMGALAKWSKGVRVKRRSECEPPPEAACVQVFREDRDGEFGGGWGGGPPPVQEVTSGRGLADFQ